MAKRRMRRRDPQTNYFAGARLAKRRLLFDSMTAYGAAGNSATLDT